MELRRGVSSGMLAAVQPWGFHPVLMVYLDWPGEVVRCHSGAGTIAYGGQSWTGVGKFGSISMPEESGGMASTEAVLSLVGEVGDIFDALDAPIRGHAGRILLGCVTEAGGNVLVADPTDLYAGVMDSSRVVVSGSDGQIEHAIEITLTGGPGARSIASIYHSAEDQARLHPGDTAGRHVIHALARQEAQRWPAR